MKIKLLTYILALFLFSASETVALQEVVDTTNLIQNIEHTLRTIHIESSTMAMIAQKAKSLGNEAQMLINLYNQLQLAKQNIENVAALVRTGKYKSIQELNQMCYAVQRVGYSVDGIGRTFKQLFPETYELYKKEKERQKKLKEQEEARDQKANEALNLQEYILDDKQNSDLNEDINEILIKSKSVTGIKGAIQLQTQLISLLLNENRKLDTLLAASLRSQTMKEKNEIAKERIQEEEKKQFMKDWGVATTPKNVMKDFP